MFERREFSMAGTRVKHPQGDLLIDTGFGRDVDADWHNAALHQPKPARSYADLPRGVRLEQPEMVGVLRLQRAHQRLKSC